MMDELEVLALRVLGPEEPELRAAFAGGKRARPLLMEAVCAHLGEPFAPLRTAALAVELFHCATLLHDDVIDDGSRRRGAAPLFRARSVHEAVLIGDALALRAIQVLGQSPKLLPAFLRTVALVVEGQLMEREPLESMGQYLAYIEKKTASLFTLCAALPCQHYGVKDEAVLRFAKEFGLAFQIANDLEKDGEAHSILALLDRGAARALLAEKVAFLRAAGVLPPGSPLLALLERAH